jgi:hypothetical protein
MALSVAPLPRKIDIEPYRVRFCQRPLGQMGRTPSSGSGLSRLFCWPMTSSASISNGRRFAGSPTSAYAARRS